MTLTDGDLAHICAELYANPVASAWDLFWPQSEHGLTAALRRVGAHDVIVHRGSTTVEDWWDDLGSELPIGDPDIGLLPFGFALPLLPFYTKTAGLIRPGPILIGHSLGAARAVEHAGKLAAKGNRPLAVVVWGEPKPGMAELANALDGVPVRSYRNRADPVPTVPVTMGLLAWQHGHAITPLNVAPAPSDSGPFADHHFPLYEAGTAALSPQPVVLA